MNKELEERLRRMATRLQKKQAAAAKRAKRKANPKVRQAEAPVHSERVTKQKRPVLTSRFQNEDVPVVGFKNKDAARYLNVSVWTLARLVQRGLIRAHRA